MFSLSLIFAILVDVHTFNLQLVLLLLICIFMISNEIKTIFHIYVGPLDILFVGIYLFKYFAYFFIWVSICFLSVCRE